jgi:hypothetical protein
MMEEGSQGWFQVARSLGVDAVGEAQLGVALGVATPLTAREWT